MKILKFKVESYQSFSDSGWVDLGDGFNLIVGQNNVGKSALARCISTSFQQSPHRSPDEFRAGYLSASIVQIEIEFSGAEFGEVWMGSGRMLYWPVPDQHPGRFDEFLYYLAQDNRRVLLRKQAGGGFQPPGNIPTQSSAPAYQFCP